MADANLTPDWDALIPKTLGDAAERESFENGSYVNVTEILIKDAMEQFYGTVGLRYRNATLDNYQIANDNQRSVVGALRAYADDMPKKISDGCGIVLFGSVGTGKDHLLIALAKIAIERYRCSVAWVNGTDLFGRLRDAIETKMPEKALIDPLTKVHVLILSDPVPDSGLITPFQSDILLRILDKRYRMMCPTWVSMNVPHGSDASKILGPKIYDRIRDGALCKYCKWESYRKSAT